MHPFIKTNCSKPLNNTILTACVLALFSLIASSSVSAHELGQSASLSGFGTLGLVHNNNSEGDFTANDVFHPIGAGRSQSTSYKVDSKAGLQIDWHATSRLDFTGQLMSRQNPDKSWTPQIELALIKAMLLPELQIRVGRIRPALYMLSDFLDVNYANPWVRPPVEFYATAPISRMEGFDLLWRPQSASLSWLIQPFFGETQLDITDNGELTLEKLAGLNINASHGNMTYRAGYTQSSITVDDARIANAVATLASLCAADPVACSQASALNPYEKTYRFSSLGGTWDNGDYFLTGEWGQRKGEAYVGDLAAWYLSGGKRFGKWTPYVTYASHRLDSPTRFTGSTKPLTNGIVEALLQYNPMDQQTWTLGTRYDISDGMALKLQWERIETKCKTPSPGTCMGRLYNATNTARNLAQDADIFSLSLDFVF